MNLKNVYQMKRDYLKHLGFATASAIVTSLTKTPPPMTLPQETISPVMTLAELIRYEKAGLVIHEDAGCTRLQEAHFLVFEDGRLYNTNRNRFVIPHMSKHEYLRYTLNIDSHRNPIRVHRLVATAFIPNPLELSVVNHLDGNKFNNHVGNLEWTTPAGNSRHAKDTGLIKGRLNDPIHSKPVIQLSLDGEFISEYPSTQEASRVTGVLHSSISICARGGSFKKKKNGERVWWNANSAGGYKWDYKNIKIKPKSIKELVGLLGEMVSRFEDAALMADQDIDSELIKKCKTAVAKYKEVSK
jgi:hypothetical protein